MNDYSPKVCEYHQCRYWGKECGHCERENDQRYRDDKLFATIFGKPEPKYRRLGEYGECS